MEVTRRRGRRRKKLLDELKDRRGYSHLKEEALDRIMWRNRFRGGFGPVVRQNTELLNEPPVEKHWTVTERSTTVHAFLDPSPGAEAAQPLQTLFFSFTMCG